MKLFFALFCAFLASCASAEDWVSPIDEKYKMLNQKLFAEVVRARALLDSWRGQPQILQEAKGILDSVVQKDDSFAPAYREYGRFYIMAGDDRLELAEKSTLKSIEIEPNYADSYVLLGHLYEISKRYSEAKVALDKAESIGTGIPWLPINRAILLRRDKKYEEAIRLLQSVVDSKTSESKAYNAALDELAEIYEKMGRYADANEAHKRCIAYKPDSAWVYGNYAYFLLFRFNDVDGAIDNGRKALRLMDYGAGRFTLASALYTKWAMLIKEGDPGRKSQEYFEEAWRLFPYIDKVIKKTEKYPYTRITAEALRSQQMGVRNPGGR
jgi:tetratricopeptide (TPR) repeat protein